MISSYIQYNNNNNQTRGGTLTSSTNGEHQPSTYLKIAYNLLSYYIAQKMDDRNAINNGEYNVHLKTNSYTQAKVDIFPSNEIDCRTRNKLLYIDYTTRGKTVIVPWLSERPELHENKDYSMALQDHVNHTVRYYDLVDSESALIMTTEYHTNFLKQAIALALKKKIKGDEELLELIALFVSDIEECTVKIQGLLSAQNDLEAAIKEDLIAILKSSGDQQKRTAQANINAFRNTIDSYERQLNQYFKKLYDEQQKLTMLEYEKDDRQIQEALEYLMKNPNVAITRVNPEYKSITFVVTSPVKNYNKDFFERYLRNTEDKDGVRYQVLKAIFLDEKYTLIAKASFTIALGTGDWTTNGRNREYDGDKAYYNSHITNADCTGTFKSEINKTMAAQDVVGTLHTMAASVGNINWEDSAIAPHVKNEIQYSKKSIMSNSTGELLDYEEVVLELIEEEKNNAPN